MIFGGDDSAGDAVTAVGHVARGAEPRALGPGEAIEKTGKVAVDGPA